MRCIQEQQKICGDIRQVFEQKIRRQGDVIQESLQMMSAR